MGLFSELARGGDVFCLDHPLAPGMALDPSICGLEAAKGLARQCGTYFMDLGQWRDGQALQKATLGFANAPSRRNIGWPSSATTQLKVRRWVNNSVKSVKNSMDL